MTLWTNKTYTTYEYCLDYVNRQVFLKQGGTPSETLVQVTKAAARTEN